MNKIQKTSPDLNEELIQKLKELYPPLFNDEGNLDQRELEALMSGFASTTSGKYEFNWAGKMASKRTAFTTSKGALKPDKSRSIDFDTTENLIIEGDNLEVLKLLQKAYFNKIKVIYIDPPYNTGKDFVYSDNFTQDKKAYWEESGTVEDGVKMDTNTESQGRYHSNWLNMMYPRLLLARNLLKEDGVIFVSIDDNEVHNLRKVMDEVFGEENFVAQIIWRKKYGIQNDAKYFSTSHEYLITYAKSIEYFETLDLPRTEKQDNRYSNPDNDPRGDWKSSDLSVGRVTEKDIYEITTPAGRIVTPPQGRSWGVSKEKFQKLVKENRIWFGESGNNVPSVKKYLSEVKDGITPTTFWDYDEVGHTDGSRKEVKTLFEGDAVFDYPKSVRLIDRVLRVSSKGNNDIILDFFAGSGTTGHAVMDLNKEDGGNRKFILVQLPEATDEKSEAKKAGFNTIANICIERVKRVADKIKKESDGKLIEEKGLDLGFKVFRLAKSYFPENLFSPDPAKTEAENIAAFEEYLEKAKQQLSFEFKTEELMYEILSKDGFELNFTKEKVAEFDKNEVYRIKDREKEALICLDSTLAEETVKLLSRGGFETQPYKETRFICLERAVDTTKKWNLKNVMGQNLWVA